MSEGNVITKRDIILKAAAEVFSAKGFYGAKIEDIAHAAEIGKGTVYEYFRSKEQLYIEMIKEAVGFFEEILKKELQKTESTRDKLVCIIRTKILFSQRYCLMAKVVTFESIPLEPSFFEWMRKLHTHHLGLIENIIQKGIEKKEIRAIDASVFALLFYGGIGVVANPFTGSNLSVVELENLITKVMNYYFDGIKINGGEQ
jgi:TetR/AcrR family fatty acid metabolism transcriptional regulator